MPPLPVCRPKEAIRALERAGFIFSRQKGSHKLYKKGRLQVTISYHEKDCKPKTLQHIIKQSGLTLEQFIALL